VAVLRNNELNQGDRRANGGGTPLPARVAAALAAAEIPPSRRGSPRPPQQAGASALLLDSF
jgi:hypothetical protein